MQATRTELAEDVLAGDDTDRRRAGRLRGQGSIGWERRRERTRALRRRTSESRSSATQAPGHRRIDGLAQAISGAKVARRDWYAGFQGNKDAREGESVRRQWDDTGGDGNTRTQRPTSSRIRASRSREESAREEERTQVPEPEPRIAETRKAEERVYDKEDARRPHAKQPDIDSQWTRADREGARAVRLARTPIAAVDRSEVGERGAQSAGTGGRQQRSRTRPTRTMAGRGAQHHKRS
ncbi:hypothetical protein GGG16DRAFT_118387 [Schizophyllum commune]